MAWQRIQAHLTFIIKLVLCIEYFLIILTLFYKVRLSKKHMVAFWSDNIKGMQQLTCRQLNWKHWFKESLSKGVWSSVYLSGLSMCLGFVIKLLFTLCSGFSILASEDSNQSTGSSAIKINLRNLVPATQTLEPAKRCPVSPQIPFCFCDCF